MATSLKQSKRLHFSILMPPTALILLIILFFLTSIIGVVTGSNSLITVPVMFQVGVDEKVAVATNMFGLVFMAVGGTIPFVRKGMIDYRSVSPLVGLTMVGSALGAMLVGVVTNGGLKLIVSVAMIAVVVFTLFRREQPSAVAVAAEEEPKRVPAATAPGCDKESPVATASGSDREARVAIVSGSSRRILLVYILTFVLAIYGGLYSGGYVTILTAMLVAFFAMPFGEAVGATKLINVFSSLIATVVFMWQGLVDYRLGAVLAVTMFAGAYIGAHYAARMNEIWLRRIFLSTVVVLAAKTIYDIWGVLI